MNAQAEPRFVKILETRSVSDIALIKATLDAEGIGYYIQGENVAFIRPLDAAALMVDEEEVERVIDLLKPLKLNYTRFQF